MKEFKIYRVNTLPQSGRNGDQYLLKKPNNRYEAYVVQPDGTLAFNQGITDEQNSRLERLSSDQISKVESITTGDISKLKDLDSQDETDSKLTSKVDKESGKSLVSNTEIEKLEGLKTQSEIDSDIATATSNASANLIPVTGTVLPRGAQIPAYITSTGKAELLGGDDPAGKTFTNTGTTPSTFNVPKGSVGYAYYDKATDSWTLKDMGELPHSGISLSDIDNPESDNGIASFESVNNLNKRIYGAEGFIFYNFSHGAVAGNFNTSPGNPLDSVIVDANIRYHILIDVSEGDQFYVNTLGGNNARGWAMLDEAGIVQSMSVGNIDYRTGEYIINILQNGQLLINWYSTTISPTDSTFKIEKKYIEYIEGIIAKVDDLDIQINGSYKEYSVNNLRETEGFYQGLVVGNPLPAISPRNAQSFCIIKPVLKNDVISVKTLGGNNARGWVLLDENNIVLAVTSQTGSIETEIRAEQTGFVLVQYFHPSISPTSDNFHFGIKPPVDFVKSDGSSITGVEIEDSLLNHENRLDNLEQGQEGSLAEFELFLVGDKRVYSNTNLSTGYYSIATTGVSLPAMSTSPYTAYHLFDDVREGDTVMVKTRGGTTIRGWALLDSNNIVLDMATTTGVIDTQFNASQDGKLLVQFYDPDQSPSSTNFNVIAETVGMLSDYSYIQDNVIADRDKFWNILVVGNSYSRQGTEYLPPIMINLGFKNFYIQYVGNGGAGFEDNLSGYNDLASVAGHYDSVVGSWVIDDGLVTIKDIIKSRKWDYCITHQRSSLSGSQEFFDRDFADIMKLIRRDLISTNTKFAFQLTWAYANGSEGYPKTVGGNVFETQMQWYNIIASNYLSLRETYFYFEKLIPSGTAIQYARGTTLGSDFNDFTFSAGDTTHLNASGRYIVALSWFMELFGEKNNIDIGTVSYFPISFTEEQKVLIFESVDKAMNSKFEVI